METTAPPSPPRWYWIASILGLLWMLIGLMALVMDLTTDEAGLAQMSEAQRALYLARPAWIIGAYVIAIGSGLAGTIALVLRRAWAVPLLALSLVTALIQFGYVLFGMGGLETLGAASLPLPVTVIVLGALLLWMAMKARRAGWLR